MKPYLFIACLLLLFVSCQQDKHTAHQKHETQKETLEFRDSSTIQMAAIIKSKYDAMPAEQTNYKNAKRAEIYLAQGQSEHFETYVQNTLRGAFELVNSGKNREAIKIYTELFDKVTQLDFDFKEQVLFNVLGMRSIAYFRLGEIENCLNNHNAESCILPFREESYHQLKEGSQKAIEDITAILRIKRDPNFIYLLNVAYMTLGNYPQGVPKEYYVPLTMKEVDTSIKRFSNIGSLIGVDANKLSGGVVVDDFTGDGNLDIVASSWDLQDDLVFYVSNGDGSYKESHMQAGLKGIAGGLNLVQADYNNDGYMDLFVLRGAWLPIGKHPNSLLKNNGDGTFTDVTVESGIFSLYPTQTAAWADFNNDGHLDVFIGNETYEGASRNPCELFLNQGNGTFINIASEVDVDIVGYIKGVSVADIDNDGDQDLFLSNLDKPNILLRNDESNSKHGFKFTDITAKSGVAMPLESFPTWFFDYDNDGFEDLFVASYPIKYYNNLASEYLNELVGNERFSDTPKLYKNLGNNKFQDVSASVGLDKVCFTMGSNFGDFNNDGYLDIYLGTGEPDLKAVIPNRAFLNNEGKQFLEVTNQAGLGHIQKGHGVSFADFDNDGDQDIYTVLGGAYEGDVFYNALFENPGHGNSFIGLELKGVESNRCAFGARIKVTLKSGQHIYRTVSSGSSFGGNPTVLNIGIPKNNEINKVEIDWPSGQKQVHSDLQINNVYLITEAEEVASKKKIIKQKFKINKHHHGHHH